MAEFDFLGPLVDRFCEKAYGRLKVSESDTLGSARAPHTKQVDGYNIEETS